MDSVLIVAEVMETLDSLDGGKVTLEESHTTMAKVYMRSEFVVSNLALTRKSRCSNVPW
jgi:hypothetical protein